MAVRVRLRLIEGDEGETERIYMCLYNKLDLNTQVTCVYCATNMYLQVAYIGNCYLIQLLFY